MTGPRECAQLLLTTLPHLMHSLKVMMRPKNDSEDEVFSLGQYRLLGMLGHRSCSLSDLALHYQVAPSTMSRSIDTLVKKEWVSRDNDPKDRRQVILALTPKGSTAFAEMEANCEESIAEVITLLTEEEQTRLYEGLKDVRTLLARALVRNGVGEGWTAHQHGHHQHATAGSGQSSPTIGKEGLINL